MSAPRSAWRDLVAGQVLVRELAGLEWYLYLPQAAKAPQTPKDAPQAARRGRVEQHGGAHASELPGRVQGPSAAMRWADVFILGVLRSQQGALRRSILELEADVARHPRAKVRARKALSAGRPCTAPEGHLVVLHRDGPVCAHCGIPLLAA